MKIIFVRHGKDDDNYRGGWSKMDLIPEGIKQAEQLANHIKENNREYQIKKIIASDLPRTMTAVLTNVSNSSRLFSCKYIAVFRHKAQKALKKPFTFTESK